MSAVTPRAAPAGLRLATTHREVPAWSTATSPGWYRVWAAVSVALIAAFAGLATVGSLVARGASATIESSTAPALLAVQDLFASVAEANAAATAVFLSGSTGDEDRARRNLYLAAVERSAEQTEEVARLAGGDDRSHQALKSIAAALVTYSGQIEASRLASQNGVAGASDRLQHALDVARDDISGSVATVTERSQDRLASQTGTGRLILGAAFAAGLVALAVLVRLQSGAYRRSNRIFSGPMLVATLLLAGALVLVGEGMVTRASALSDARTGGYDAITSTSRLQASVFELQSQLSLRLLGSAAIGGGADLDALLAAIGDDIDTIAAVADSERERAAATELGIRWDRYRTTAERIVSLDDAGDTSQAVELFRGSGLSTFNGMNTTTESVLSDNRTQFTDGVARAAAADRWQPVYSAVLPALAALAVATGALRRLGEYR